MSKEAHLNNVHIKIKKYLSISIIIINPINIL